MRGHRAARWTIVSIAAALLLVGCSSAGSVATAPAPGAIVPAATLGLAMPSSPESTSPPSAAPTASPSATPPAASASVAFPSAGPPGSVVLAFEENAQIELVSPKGQRVLIDVVDQSRLRRPVDVNDILLTTHAHPDHYDSTFVDAFIGPSLTMRAGYVSARDVSVTGIAAGHNEGDSLEASGGTDYIFVIDVAGLRIVHFGDLGQERLTASQMTAIGSVDVAISQLSNEYSDMTAANEKGFRQMAQVKPRLLIPTHLLVDTVAILKLVAKTWPVTYALAPVVTVSRAALPAKTTVLFLGDSAKFFAKLAGATPTTLP